ncbi:MAG: hypothetical protein ABI690_20285 [Chloroflexota bacterium]
MWAKQGISIKAMMGDYATEIKALCEAAHKREWGTSVDTLTSLFMTMEFFAALEIAVTRAYNHLSVFEAAHPDEGWARSLLVWITSYGAAPANLPQEAAMPHNSPGAANFIAALIDVARSVERQTPLENRVRFLANVVSNVILAELSSAWYGDHPDAWEFQQNDGDEIDDETGQTVRQIIQAEFWLDENTAARDTAAWLEVAAAVELKMSGARCS